MQNIFFLCLIVILIGTLRKIHKVYTINFYLMVKNYVNPFWTKTVKCVPILSTPLKYTVPFPKEIPVFMYWHSNILPKSVELCYNNWVYFAKQSKYNFKPTLVTDENVKEFIDLDHPCIFDQHEYPALKSDFIRLALLQKHGGVYMDASVILTEPLDWLIGDGDGHNFFHAFVNTRNMNLSCNVPVVETSFMACPPNHPFVIMWLETLSSLERCTDEKMRDFVSPIPIQKHMLPLYHIAYHALTKILIKKPLNKFSNMYLMNNQTFLNFMSNGNVNVLVENKKVQYNRLLKLIGSERRQLDKLIAEKGVKPKSFVDTYLIQTQR